MDSKRIDAGQDETSQGAERVDRTVESSEGSSAHARAPVPLGRPPRLVAAGFIGAFALSIVTVVLTGLWVRSPETKREIAVPAVSLGLAESRTVNLVLSAARALDNVLLTIEPPEGVAIGGDENRRRVGADIELRPGNNILPLELSAVAGRGGRLVVRLQRGAEQNEFTINVAVGIVAEEWRPFVQQDALGVTMRVIEDGADIDGAMLSLGSEAGAEAADRAPR